jgi:uncharacterized protein YwqG
MKVLMFYSDVLLEIEEESHRLMGDAFEMQSDMRQDYHRESRATGYPRRAGEGPARKQLPYRPSTEEVKRPWRLLAVFGSDGRLGWEWSDVGELYFWIHEQDLVARRFDMVHGVVDSA